MTSRLLLALALGAVVLAGCGDAQGVDPTAHQDVTGGDGAVRLVDRAEADLMLYVSNQSFDDEVVRLRVAVDGTTVVDGDFHVEGQHNWIRFALALEPGRHEVGAESDSGVSMAEPFTMPRRGTRYAVIDHWTYDSDDDVELTWQIQREPLAFG